MSSSEGTVRHDPARLERLKRLRLVVERLRGVSIEHFSMGRWWSEPGSGEVGLPELVATHMSIGSHLCGTSACVLGWATTVPELRRLGLAMHYIGSDCHPIGSVVYGKYDGFRVGPELFGLTLRETFFLFTDDGSHAGYVGRGDYVPDPKLNELEQAIKRIEYVLDYYFPEHKETA